MIKGPYENKSVWQKVLALIYTGEGKKASGIPAHDLTPEEVEKYGGEETILQTGLYFRPDEIKHDGG
jgi:hypothetical protein